MKSIFLKLLIKFKIKERTIIEMNIKHKKIPEIKKYKYFLKALRKGL